MEPPFGKGDYRDDIKWIDDVKYAVIAVRVVLFCGAWWGEGIGINTRKFAAVNGICGKKIGNCSSAAESGGP